MAQETPEQRAERIFKEDEDKHDEEEKEAMQLNQLQRKETVEKYKEFIEAMVIGKQKQIRYRRFLRSYLIHGTNKLFESFDEEYDYINKFGRGPWDENDIRKAFNKAEQETIVEIARGYGAFDY
jgi:hypothetical protein